VPRWHNTDYGRDKLWWFSCRGSMARLARVTNWRISTFIRRLDEAAAPGEGLKMLGYLYEKYFGAKID